MIDAEDLASERRYQALSTVPVSAGAVPTFLSALEDPSWRVRRLAAERLAEVPPSEALVDALLEVLERRDATGARNAASAVLSKLAPLPVARLLRLLRSHDADQRKLAADILGQLKDEAAAASLVEALEDPDANVRLSASEALAAIGGSLAVQALEGLLVSSEAALVVSALEGLFVVGRGVRLPLVIPHLANPLTRRSAWKVLGAIAHPTASVRLLTGLVARSTRDAALVGLAHHRPPSPSRFDEALRASLVQVADVVPWLTRGLSGGDPERRRGALRAAKALRSPELTLSVVENAAGADPDEVLATLEAIGSDGVRRLIEQPERVLELSAEARAVAGEAVLRMANASWCPALIGVLASGDLELRELAVRALGRSESEQAVGPVLACLGDERLALHAGHGLIALATALPSVVKAALLPLTRGAMEPQLVRVAGTVLGLEAKELLTRASTSPDERLRAAAVEGGARIAELGERLVRGGLLDEAALVRRAAVRASAELASSQTRALLQPSFVDPDAGVRVEACVVAGQRLLTSERTHLEALTRDAQPAVVIAALEALALLGALDDAVLDGLCAHRDPEVLKRVFTLGADRDLVVQRALWALAHPRWDVRAAAARVIAVSGAADAVAPLDAALAAERDEVARAALEAAERALLGRV